MGRLITQLAITTSIVPRVGQREGEHLLGHLQAVGLAGLSDPPG
jgi:hypothetical protein